MPRKKFYTNEQLATTRRLFQEAATRGPQKPDRYTRQQLLQELEAEYEELRRQGFTNLQIAEIASQGLGDVLGAPTLQKFFALPKRRRRKKGDNGAGPAVKSPSPKPTAPSSRSADKPQAHHVNGDPAPNDSRHLRERS